MAEEKETAPPVPSPFYFVVSPVKLVVLSVATLGIYELYWFYENWKLIKEREKLDIMPFWRAFFGFFFCHSLFKHIKDSAGSHGVAVTFGPGTLTLAWILLTLCWRLPDPFWLISYFAVAAFLPVQKTVNTLNSLVAPHHDPNTRFSGLNIAGIVAGALLFILVVIAFFIDG